MRLRSLSLLLAIVAFAGVANATQITQTALYPSLGAGNDTSNNNYQFTTWNQSYLFNKFNTNLGTLNFITIQIVDGLTGYVQITNQQTLNSGTYKASIEDVSDFSLTPSPSGTNSFYEDDFSSPTLKTVSPNPLAAGQTGTTPVQTLSSDSGAVAPSSLPGNTTTLSNSDFTASGGGTFTIYEQVVGKSVVSGQSPYAAQVFTGGQSSITIIYDYTPGSAVPEPASLLLLGSGLAFVARKLRRRAV